MKKRILSAAALAIVLTTLIACSASNDTSAAMGYGEVYDMTATSVAPQEAPVMSESEVSYSSANADMYFDEGAFEESGSAISAGEIDVSVMTEKIIYNANATIETMEFDKAVKAVDELMTKFGGFIESSSVSGVDYYSKQYGGGGRTANYTIRIPIENYSSMTDSLSAIGNVTYLSTYSENITTQYYDSQSRLSAYRTEEDRLLDMLAKVDSIEAMIAVESRLSDVRYQIESITTQLNSWDTRVRYSTITIYLYEVAELTVETPVVRTYWQQVSDGFNNSLKGIASFFKNLFKGLVVSLPVLLILAVLAVIVILIIKKVLKRVRLKEADAARLSTKANDDTERKD